MSQLRWLLLALVVAGCSSDPLKADVEMFCDATKGTDWKTFSDFGPYVAEHAKTDEFKQLLLEPVRGTMDISQFAEQIRALMQKTGVTECRTLELFSRRPGA